MASRQSRRLLAAILSRRHSCVSRGSRCLATGGQGFWSRGSVPEENVRGKPYFSPPTTMAGLVLQGSSIGRYLPVRAFSWWSRSESSSKRNYDSGSQPDEVMGSVNAVPTGSHSDQREDLVHEMLGNSRVADRGLDVSSWENGNASEIQRELLSGRDFSAVGGEILENITNQSIGTSIWSILRLPADGVVAIVEGVHNVTGAPWWLTIVGSTLAFRAAIFPFTITYIKKSAQFASAMPLLPPFRPPPESGKTLAEQYRIFTKRRLELGVPSPFWTIAGFVQAPLFLYWIVALRGMAMAGHPGFDTGGVLWFSDLTVPVQGALGALFPTLVAVTYFINIQIAFRVVKPRNDVVAFFMKIYQWWLEAMTIPLFLMGFYLPQGVFMYWLTNNFFNLAQSVGLQNDSFRARFGLPLLSEMEKQRAKQQAQSTETENINPELLDLDGLLLAATQCVANDRDVEATNLLKFALEKYPDEPEAYNIYGMLHIKKRNWSEALEYYSLVMSKAQDDPPRITALMGAGIALFNQGKRREAVEVMKPLIDMNVPKEPVVRVKYLRALVTLSSAMSQEGLKEEALPLLERAAKLDSSINVYVKELKEELESTKK
ncbi:hypothetical protein R1sor_021061 [Riccia sorocarpa]|uniref:Membrane insertase YidC/Oxa/ALB C-terminal domain-containing protein n=1 Tax=Riccia sorocarpa TaxID=122646 RepID=A0ABD3GFZ4_9MARC